jgi:hypothetical protein
VLWSARTGGTGLDYIAHITRGSDNVATHTVEADSDAQAFDIAIEWAASLHLAPDDDVLLAIRLPSGTFKTFSRKDF